MRIKQNVPSVEGYRQMEGARERELAGEDITRMHKDKTRRKNNREDEEVCRDTTSTLLLTLSSFVVGLSLAPPSDLSDKRRGSLS